MPIFCVSFFTYFPLSPSFHYLLRSHFLLFFSGVIDGWVDQAQLNDIVGPRSVDLTVLPTEDVARLLQGRRKERLVNLRTTMSTAACDVIHQQAIMAGDPRGLSPKNVARKRNTSTTKSRVD